MLASAPPTYTDAVNSSVFTTDRTMVSPDQMQADGPVAAALASKRPIPPQQGAPGTEQLPHSAAVPPGYGYDTLYTPGVYHTAPNTPMYSGPGSVPMHAPFPGHPGHMPPHGYHHGGFHYGMPMMPIPQQQPQIIMVPQAAPATAPTNVIVNSNPNSNSDAVAASDSCGLGIGGGQLLICPKCRKGCIARVRSKFYKKLVIGFSVVTCPLTCCLPLILLRYTYSDKCTVCGKGYSHLGKKRNKKTQLVVA